MFKTKQTAGLLLLGVVLCANSCFATTVQAVFAKNLQPIPHQKFVLFMEEAPEIFPTSDNQGNLFIKDPNKIIWAEPETIRPCDCEGHLIKTNTGKLQLRFTGPGC